MTPGKKQAFEPTGKKQAFEPTGLIPRSIVRTLERFYKQLLPRTKYLAIREYRLSRYQVLVSIRCLCTLLFLPLITRIVANWLIFPQVEQNWRVSYQDEHVFSEIDQFSQVIYFDSLLDNNFDYLTNKVALNPLSMKSSMPRATKSKASKPLLEVLPMKSSLPSETSLPLLEARATESRISMARSTLSSLPKEVSKANSKDCRAKITMQKNPLLFESMPVDSEQGVVSKVLTKTNNLTQQDQALQQKFLELANRSHSHGIQTITNVFADFCGISVLIFLLATLKPEITILKSFVIEVIYNLSDTTKSFLLILMTDLLVGFHSPRGWETMFSLILDHFGIPENQDFIFLFVATLPVILDTVFKYWIFRHLNKISPSTVATYHNMIE